MRCRPPLIPLAVTFAARETALTPDLPLPATGAAAPRTLALVCVLLSTVLAAGCGADKDERLGGGRSLAATRGEAGRPTYREVDVARSGTITGVVRLDGRAPRDSIVRTTADREVCGESVSERVLVDARDRVGEAIVWLDGVRAGKPLPDTRRFELTTERCRLEPRVQAALVGGMLNVKSADPVSHATRFLLAGADSTLELVRQSGAAQLVPTAAPLARPARVEVRCDRHPWATAWIQVFDHPYFAVTRRDGAFRLDSVPSGQYRLVAWHEKLGNREQRVTVEAGEAARVELVF